MRKKIVLLFLVLSLFLTSGCFITDWYHKIVGGGDNTEEVLAKTDVIFKSESGDYGINVEIADTSTKRIKGLMGRDELDADTGMLFVFEDEDIREFWMKNTVLYLDLVFISADKKVVDIRENFEPCYEGDSCPDYRSRRDAQYVVEMKGGTVKEKGIKVGDAVEFEL
jgi:uncharacterized protein